jgi:serine phosphatase RsbU (regulator of sigma subunit)
MLAATLNVSDLERRDLATLVHRQRVDAARAAGELEAARRIQTGILPTRESALLQERRVDIFTHMHPAREVGGDLYDFYLLPNGRFLVLQGDVSGKGLGAAMFMAVTKAVAKSCALREELSVSQMMTTFNREIARENPEQMFVTVAALVMDLTTGEVDYCNAGHEPPLLLRRIGDPVVLDDAGGPPLCVVDDFPYGEARIRIEPRDILVLASDGITEAMNRDGSVYGRDRLKALLQSPERRALELSVMGNEILASVRNFEGSAEPSDDQTLLLVQWRGR